MTRALLLRGLSLLFGLWLAVAAGAVTAKTPQALPVITSYQIRLDRSGSQLNWSTRQLEAVGIGYAEGTGNAAKYEALAVAQSIMEQEATRALATLSLDGQTTLGALNDEISQVLRKLLVNNLVVIDQKWNQRTGAYTLVGVLPLYGPAGVSLLGLHNDVLAKPLNEVADAELAIHTPLPMGHTLQSFPEPYTGVIVDADRLALAPCLFPSLLRPDGIPFWGPFTASTPVQLANGPIHYAANLQEALTQQLAGKRPLVITAIGSGRGILPVLSIDDVFLALTWQKNKQLLQRGPVVITLGR